MGKGAGSSKGASAGKASAAGQKGGTQPQVEEDEEESEDDYEVGEDLFEDLFGSQASADAAEQGAGASDDEAVTCVRSPFGHETFSSAQACWEHAQQNHGFSIQGLREKVGKREWTDYHRMRLVNYLRSLGPEAAKSEALKLGKDSKIWTDDELLRPYDPEDALLFEDDMEDDEAVSASGDAQGATAAASSSLPPGSITADQELARLRAEHAALKRLLCLAEDDMEEMPLCGLDHSHAKPAPCRQKDTNCDLKLPRAFVLDPSLAEAVHKLAQAKPELLEGRRVLDAGCSAAVLSALCFKLGASSVTSVDHSSAALALANSVLSANGCHGCLVEGKAEDNLRELAEQQAQGGKAPGFDVLVSQRFLEDLRLGPVLPSLLTARHRWLRPGGLVLPARVELWACAVDLSSEVAAAEAWTKRISSLGDLDLSALKPDVMESGEVVDPAKVASTQPTRVLELDLGSAELEEALPCELPFALDLRPDSYATTVALYLEACLDVSKEGAATRVSAAPSTGAWQRRQVVLHLPAPGPPPERALRLSGAEFQRLQCKYSAVWEPESARLVVTVSVVARREAGSQVHTSRTVTLE